MLLANNLELDLVIAFQCFAINKEKDSIFWWTIFKQLGCEWSNKYAELLHALFLEFFPPDIVCYLLQALSFPNPVIYSFLNRLQGFGPRIRNF